MAENLIVVKQTVFFDTLWGRLICLAGGSCGVYDWKGGLRKGDNWCGTRPVPGL